jgi:diguanylate cyclase (GGDEF)-like protein/PAS domain S-box-containing protein
MDPDDLTNAAAHLTPAETNALVAASFDRVIIFDRDGRYLKVPAGRNSLHRPFAETIGRHLSEVLPEPQASQFLSVIRRAADTGEIQRLEYEVDIRGVGVWFDGTVAPTADGTIVWVARDISRQRRAESALRESEEDHRNLLAALPAIVYSVSPTPPFEPTYVSPGVEALGYTLDEWLSTPDMWLKIIHPDDRERVVADTEAALRSGSQVEYEYRVTAKDGSIRWMHDRGDFVRDSTGRVVSWRGVMIDVTDRRALQDRLASLSEQDELTGLYNRRGFRRMVEQELKSGRRAGRRGALFYIDLDAFKPINDSYGHAAGDEALRATAEVFRRCLREEDLVGRLGGDEFGIFAIGITSPAEADLLLARLYRSSNDANLEQADHGRPFSIAFSVGLALVGENDDVNALLARADAALYAQKSARRRRSHSD